MGSKGPGVTLPSLLIAFFSSASPTRKTLPIFHRPGPVPGPMLVAVKNLEPSDRPLMPVLDLAQDSLDVGDHRQFLLVV